MNCVSNKASMLIVKFTQLAETEPDVKKAVKFFFNIHRKIRESFY